MFILKVAICLLIVCLSSTCFAQPASVPVQEMFAPLVLPPRRAPVPRTPEQQTCNGSAELVRSHPTETFFIETAERWEAIARDTLMIVQSEALARWMVHDLIRRGEVFSQFDPLGYVRRRYSMGEILEAVCSYAPEGSCQPLFVWRAMFERAPWCASVERGRLPSTDASFLVPRTLVGRICLARVREGVSLDLQCPAQLRRTIRVFSRPAQNVPPSNGTAGDAFTYGGLGATGTGWGGGGTGEGTIGTGGIGAMGHGAGSGSGQGFGVGAGRELRNRGTSGPTVHPPREHETR